MPTSQIHFIAADQPLGCGHASGPYLGWQLRSERDFISIAFDSTKELS